MKNFFILIALIFGLIHLASAQKNLPKPIKATEKFKNKETAKTETKNNRTRGIYPDQSAFLYYSTQYDTSYREIYTYVPGTGLHEEIIREEFVSSGVYEKLYKTNISYNSGLQVTSSTDYIWYGSSWEPSSKTQTDYDQYGNEKLFTYSYWDPSTSTWIVNWGYKTDYTYSTAGKILTATYSYNDGMGGWELNFRITSSYNSNNQQTSQLYEYYDLGSWMPMEKEEYTLDATGAWTELLGYEWNEMNNVWDSTYKVIDISWHNFNDFLPLGATFQEFDGTNWINSEKNTWAYNSSDDLLSETRQMWIFQNWVNTTRSTYAYDSKGNNTEYLDQVFVVSWVTTGGTRHNYQYNSNGSIMSIENTYFDMGQWVNHMKIINYYLTVGIAKNNHPLSQRFYPNPVADKLYIETDAVMASSIRIFNIAGQNIVSKTIAPGQGKVAIDVTSLENGVYFLQIQDGEKTSTHKLVKK